MGRVSGNNEWNAGDFNYICMRGQACVTTYFGLKVCLASNKWYAQVYVPRCYQNKGISGACGNFNGNKWDDGHVPGTSPIRTRRAIEPEQPEIVKRDADQDPSKIVKKAFDNSTPGTREATCNQDYDTVFAACDRVASESLLLLVMTMMLQHLGWRPVYSMPAVKMKRTFVQTTKHTRLAVLMTI